MATTKQVKQAVDNIIDKLTGGIGNIYLLATSDNTLSGALSTIKSNTDKSTEFDRVFGFSVDTAITVERHAPGLRLCDIVLGRFISNTESPFDRVLDTYGGYTGGVFDI